jgi:hypothetical protein
MLAPEPAGPLRSVPPLAPTVLISVTVEVFLLACVRPVNFARPGVLANAEGTEANEAIAPAVTQAAMTAATRK